MSAGRRAFYVFVLAPSLLACRPREEQQNVVLRDQAQICLGRASADADGGARGGPLELTPGFKLPVVARSPVCLSVCATERKGKCTMKREGDRLVVATELSWNAPVEVDKKCPGACSYLEVPCGDESLPLGITSIVQGKSVAMVEAPSKLATSCLREGAQIGPDAGAAPVAAAAPAVSLTPAAMSAAAAIAAPPSTGAPPTPKPGDAVCALPYPKGQTAKGAPIGITVTRPNPCEGASCSTARPKCTIKRKGAEIVLKTDFPAPGAKPKMPCSEDCNALLASCRSEALPPGKYTIKHGTQTLTVQLPLSKETCTP